MNTTHPIHHKTNALAELPSSVSFAQAAALPVAGLTALYALEHGGNLIARPVLITAASGGVGLFACQLASLAGALVVGQVRHAPSAARVQQAGADHVVVDENIAAAAAFGPYHLIIDQLGGQTLAEGGHDTPCSRGNQCLHWSNSRPQRSLRSGACASGTQCQPGFIQSLF